MNLLNVQGVFAMALGVVGLAFIADAAQMSGNDPQYGHAVEAALNRPAELVSGLLEMSARADEMQAHDDLSDLLRIDLPNTDVSIGEGVATQVHSSSTVRKVAFGQVRDVQVYSTATGTYSTDGLASPHVTYTGVEAVPRPTPVFMVSVNAFFWQAGLGWTPVPASTSNSFATYQRSHALPPLAPSGGMTCSEEAGVRICG